MTPQRKKERLIELRAQGLSYEKIAIDLGIAKQTAITWSRELNIGIQNARSFYRDELVERLKISSEQRLISFSNLQKRLEGEIENRNLSDLSTKEVLELLLKTLRALKDESSPVQFSVEESAFKVDLTKTNSWSA